MYAIRSYYDKSMKKEETKVQDKLKTPDLKETPEQKTNESTSIIRNEPIDVYSIDINKDGKVFQDMMDWNVISDDPGKCPLCGMTLKEVSIDAVKKNLIDNGFAVKE